jgi:hypothetical protein
MVDDVPHYDLSEPGGLEKLSQWIAAGVTPAEREERAAYANRVLDAALLEESTEDAP